MVARYAGQYSWPTAGDERAGDRANEIGPIFLPDRLDHLDAGHRLEARDDIAIVAQLDACAAAEARRGEIALARRHGDAGDVGAARGRRFGDRAPAAADVEQPYSGTGRDAIEQQVDLAHLRLRERLVRPDRLGEHRARIGHPGIEPSGVEILAEIVVERDVAPGAAAIVAAERVEHVVDQPARPARASDLAQRAAIAHEQIEQRHRIGAGPFALGPAAIPADRTADRQPHQRPPAAQDHLRLRPRCAPAEETTRAIGQHCLDRAMREPRVDMIEQAAEGWSKQAREQPSAGGEAPVGRDKVAAAGGLDVHRRRTAATPARMQLTR